MVLPSCPSPPSSPSPYFVGSSHSHPTLEATASDLLSLLPPGPFHMVGHSLGGYLSFELLRQADPGRIRSLLLCSTQVRADTPAIQRHRRMLLDKVRASGVGAGVSSPTVLLGSASCGSEAILGEVLAMAEEVGVEGFCNGCLSVASRADSRDTLQTATTAIRILVGDEYVSLCAAPPLTFAPLTRLLRSFRDGITPRACSAEMGRLVDAGRGAAGALGRDRP